MNWDLCVVRSFHSSYRRISLKSKVLAQWGQSFDYSIRLSPYQYISQLLPCVTRSKSDHKRYRSEEGTLLLLNRLFNWLNFVFAQAYHCWNSLLLQKSTESPAARHLYEFQFCQSLRMIYHCQSAQKIIHFHSFLE